MEYEYIRVASWIPLIAVLSWTQATGRPWLTGFPIVLLRIISSCWEQITLALANPNYRFLIIVALRYYRLVGNLLAYYILYEPDPIPANPTVTAKNVHVVLPTIDPGNEAFVKCVQSILRHSPGWLTVVCGGEQHKQKAAEQVDHALNHATNHPTFITIDHISYGHKRQQMCHVLDRLAEHKDQNRDTIVVFVDDHVWWNGDRFLEHLLAPLEGEHVALVGTRKRVARDRGRGFKDSFINFIGSIYLERHNFECSAANAIDGGVMVISARTLAIRARVAMEEEFRRGFTNERFFFNRFGPLNSDDDNYITRYVVKKRLGIKFQNDTKHEEIMYTTLGIDGWGKICGQFDRWARTQWRSNATSLFRDTTVWIDHPWTSLTVYLTWFFNFAAIWDPLIVYTWYHSTYQNVQWYHIAAIILGSKMIKLYPYFRRHPEEVFYFFPLYIVFGYCHSWVKLKALFTFYNIRWSGRPTTDDGTVLAATNDDDDDNDKQHNTPISPLSRRASSFTDRRSSLYDPRRQSDSKSPSCNTFLQALLHRASVSPGRSATVSALRGGESTSLHMPPLTPSASRDSTPFNRRGLRSDGPPTRSTRDGYGSRLSSGVVPPMLSPRSPLRSRGNPGVHGPPAPTPRPRPRRTSYDRVRSTRFSWDDDMDHFVKKKIDNVQTFKSSKPMPPAPKVDVETHLRSVQSLGCESSKPWPSYDKVRRGYECDRLHLNGGGIFAREEHLPAVTKSKDLTLKAIYSRSLKSAQSLGTDPGKVDLYSDDSGEGKGLDDLLARNDIGAAIIALPIKNQPEYIKKALLAGKHVLSEKPVAENVKDAVELIEWHEKEIAPKGVTWGVAENVRFWAASVHAGEQRAEMGRALTFRARQQMLVEPGGKYYETDWRKVPTHQGGFLLDGGVHFAAVLRLLLRKDDPIVSLSAQTAQLQEHLPPVDTIEAVAKTKSGAVGSMSMSVGTTVKGSEYHIGCEKGFVSVSGNIVTVDGKEEEIQEEGSGVTPEVRAWGEALSNNKENALQSPREALADLEIIEVCLRSGEQEGKPIDLKHQQL
ncbi:hypothetical protein LTS08_003301 [Lithohypha guttulata]|nr:hypothetical protein LTS08_003301 [Lithohypha guttulata]